MVDEYTNHEVQRVVTRRNRIVEGAFGERHTGYGTVMEPCSDVGAHERAPLRRVDGEDGARGPHTLRHVHRSVAVAASQFEHLMARRQTGEVQEEVRMAESISMGIERYAVRV